MVGHGEHVDYETDCVRQFYSSHSSVYALNIIRSSLFYRTPKKMNGLVVHVEIRSDVSDERRCIC